MKKYSVDDSIFEYVRFFADEIMKFKDKEGKPAFFYCSIDDFVGKYDTIIKNLGFQKLIHIRDFIGDAMLFEIIKSLKEKKIIINVRQLWVLAVFVYCKITSKAYITYKPSAGEELSNLLDFIENEMNGGKDIASITFEAKNGKKFSLTNEMTLKHLSIDMDKEFHNSKEDIMEYYKNHQVSETKEIADIEKKAIINYLFAKNMEIFFAAYFTVKRGKRNPILPEEKNLILRVMYHFKFYFDIKKNKAIMPTMDTYRKMMSEFKDIKLKETINYIELDEKKVVLPFVFIPESYKKQ